MKIHRKKPLLAASIVLTLFAALCGMMRSAAVSAADNDCKCEDLPDLINRRHEVQAAIKATEQQKAKLDEEAKKLGRVVPYTDDSYKLYLSNWINLAIDAAAAGMPDVHRAHGPDGFTKDCTPTAEATRDTACLWQGLAINEQARQSFCSSRLRGGADLIRGTLGGNWMERYPLSSFADVALQGYQAELAFLDKQISQIMSKCNYGKWSGTINVTWTKQTVINVSLPRPGENPASAPHGSDVTTNIEKTQAQILLINGTPYASSDVEITRTEAISSTRTTSCHGGMAGPKLSSLTYSNHSDLQFGNMMFGHGGASIGSPNSTGEYTITVDTPGGYGRGTQTSQIQESGECAGKPSNNTYAVERKPMNGLHLVGKGDAKPSATELVTNYIFPVVTESVGNTTTTTSYSMDWDLRRKSP